MTKAKNYWKDTSNQLNTFKELELKLQINEPTDWYNVGYGDVFRLGGDMLLRQFNKSVSKMVKHFYPEVKWDLARYNLYLLCSNRL
jgi:hypothetical protein